MEIYVFLINSRQDYEVSPVDSRLTQRYHYPGWNSNMLLKMILFVTEAQSPSEFFKVELSRDLWASLEIKLSIIWILNNHAIVLP